MQKITQNEYLIFKLLENGNLLLTATNAGKDKIRELRYEADSDIYLTLLEDSVYTMIPPEAIDVLTDSPIIALEMSVIYYDEASVEEEFTGMAQIGEIKEVGVCWYLPNYLIIDDMVAFMSGSSIEFTKLIQ